MAARESDGCDECRTFAMNRAAWSFEVQIGVAQIAPPMFHQERRKNQKCE
jgi:hypothetical protein